MSLFQLHRRAIGNDSGITVFDTESLVKLLFNCFFTLNGNMTGVCRCRTQGVFAAASVIFCPDDGFYGISAVLIQSGILQGIFRQNVLILCGGAALSEQPMM